MGATYLPYVVFSFCAVVRCINAYLTLYKTCYNSKVMGFAYNEKLSRLVVAGAVALIAIIGLLVYREAHLASVRVALSWFHQAQFAGMYVADANGLYRKEGITVHLIERDLKGGGPAELLATGKADIALLSSADFLHAVDRGEDIVALAAVFQTTPITIASFQSAGIKSPEDLVGKKIGLAVVTEESKLPIYALLEESNISKDKVSFIDVGYDQVEALFRGEVDAISIYRTNELYELEKKGTPYSLMFPERFGVDMYGDIIAVRRSYLQGHEKEIGGFLRATFVGWSIAKEDPEEATRHTLEVDNPKYHDAAREAYILHSALKMVQQYPKQTLGQMLPMHWEYMHDLFKKHGLVRDLTLENHFPSAEDYQKIGFPE